MGWCRKETYSALCSSGVQNKVHHLSLARFALETDFCVCESLCGSTNAQVHELDPPERTDTDIGRNARLKLQNSPLSADQWMNWVRTKESKEAK